MYLIMLNKIMQLSEIAIFFKYMRSFPARVAAGRHAGARRHLQPAAGVAARRPARRRGALQPAAAGRARHRSHHAGADGGGRTAGRSDTAAPRQTADPHLPHPRPRRHADDHAGPAAQQPPRRRAGGDPARRAPACAPRSRQRDAGEGDGEERPRLHDPGLRRRARGVHARRTEGAGDRAAGAGVDGGRCDFARASCSQAAERIAQDGHRGDEQAGGGRRVAEICDGVATGPGRRHAS